MPADIVFNPGEGALYQGYAIRPVRPGSTLWSQAAADPNSPAAAAATEGSIVAGLPAPQFGVAGGPDSFDRLRERLSGGMQGGASQVAGSSGPTQPQDWDAFRRIIGENVPGRGVVPVPQIFDRNPSNGEMVEQSPLASIPQRALTMQEELRRVDASGLNPQRQAALSNEIIRRHNLNLDLQNEQTNAARGLFTPASRESIGRFGANPMVGGGTEQMTAGAAATRAGADAIQARTGAATLEAAMTPAARRERFIRGLPSGMTPGQITQLADAEEARGAFGGGGLNVGAVLGGGAPPVAQSFINQAATTQSAPPPVYQDLQRQIESIPQLARPVRPATGPAPADMTPGELVARANRSFPALFTGESGQRNRAALDAYLRSRFTSQQVEDALRGTRVFPGRLGATTMSPPNAPMWQRTSEWTDDLEGRAMLEAALRRNQW